MKWVKALTPFFLSVLCLICILQSVVYGTIPESGSRICMIRLDQPYTGADGVLDDADSEYDGSFTLWGEQKNIFVTNPDLGRKSEGTVLTVSGRSGLVMDSSRELDVQQKTRCLIDDKMAWHLFGSTEADGQYLTVNGREYQVAGRLYHADNTVLIQQGNKGSIEEESPNTGGQAANTGEENKNAVEGDRNTAGAADGAGIESLDSAMNYAAVQVLKVEGRSEAVTRFRKATGLGGTEIPNHLYQVWGQGAARVMQFLLLLPLFYEWGKLLLCCRRYPVLFMLLLLTGLFVLAVIYWILEIHLHVPVELLPSRWSDFEFWPSLWKQKWSQAKELILMGKTLPQLYDYGNSIRAVCYSAAALILAHFSYFRRKDYSGRALFAGVVICPFFSLLMIVNSSRAASYVVDGRAVWLFVPALLCTRYLLMQARRRYCLQVTCEQ